MEKQTRRSATSAGVVVESFPRGELSLGNPVLLQPALRGKARNDHSRSGISNELPTIPRLLFQVESLLTDFQQQGDTPGRAMALQGLSLLGQDLLDFVRENVPNAGGTP